MKTTKKTNGSKNIEVKDVSGFANVAPTGKTLGDIFKEMDEQFKEMEDEFKQMDDKITVFNEFLNKLYKHK
jgi:hypothetical protein